MDPSAYGFCNLMAPFGVNSSTYGLNNEPSSSGLVNLEASLGMDPSIYGLKMNRPLKDLLISRHPLG